MIINNQSTAVLSTHSRNQPAEIDVAGKASGTTKREDKPLTTEADTDSKAQSSNASQSNASNRSAGAESSGLSPAELVLKRLREQIAEVKEKIAEIEAKLLASQARDNGTTSPQTETLRSQFDGLQGQLSSLMGAYNDAVQEALKMEEKGSVIDTYQ